MKIFKNDEFGEIRALEIDGDPWFIGKDVADILGYANSKDALATHVDSKDRVVIKRSENATFEIPNRGLTAINESGLYSLIMSSKLESAKRFKHWVTSDVLPSIRKNGGYINGQDDISDEELFIKALFVAQRKIEDRNKQIEVMTPKAIFADAVAASHTSILVGDLAKLIKQNGVKIGGQRLFSWLRENGYLIKRKGADYNMPTQRSMEQGLFEIKETSINHADGHISISKTPKVTGKGQQYFVNKFIKAYEVGDLKDERSKC